MSNIVERLRVLADDYVTGETYQMLVGAANRIEALEAALSAATARAEADREHMSADRTYIDRLLSERGAPQDDGALSGKRET